MAHNLQQLQYFQKRALSTDLLAMTLKLSQCWSEFEISVKVESRF